MLTKEYRIPLPLTVEEYRIAQLYMIAKKSREESVGRGAGVEILENRPYEDGPGPERRGQYTRKVYHVLRRLPSWLRALLPASVVVYEEAWNAYPYTRTKYTCPFVERFSMDIETYFFQDRGDRTNVFGLTPAQREQCPVEFVDIVNDPFPDKVRAEDDPRVFRSAKTGRGPLPPDWRESAEPIMTAYKLVRAEFRYWGLQTRIERFIDLHAIRHTLLQAHRAAWCWIDEWIELTMEDIRAMERETQAALREMMAQSDESVEDGSAGARPSARLSASMQHARSVAVRPGAPATAMDSAKALHTVSSDTLPPRVPDDAVHEKHGLGALSLLRCQSDTSVTRRAHGDHALDMPDSRHRDSNANSGSTTEPGSAESQMGTAASADAGDNDGSEAGGSDEDGHNSEGDGDAAAAAVDGGDEEQEEEDDDDENAVFYDAPGSFQDLTVPPEAPSRGTVATAASVPRVIAPSSNRRSTVRKAESRPAPSDSASGIEHLVIILHAADLATPHDVAEKISADASTLISSVSDIMRCHYGRRLCDSVAFRAVRCCTVTGSALALLESLVISPQRSSELPSYAAVVPMAFSGHAYRMAVDAAREDLIRAHRVFCEEQRGFIGDITLVGDALGGVIAYEILANRSATLPFAVAHLFTLGSPIGLLLGLARHCHAQPPVAPNCGQLYNIFFPADRLASRIEPLLLETHWRAALPPILLPRYDDFPLGNGQLNTVADLLSRESAVTADATPLLRAPLGCLRDLCDGAAHLLDRALGRASSTGQANFQGVIPLSVLTSAVAVVVLDVRPASLFVPTASAWGVVVARLDGSRWSAPGALAARDLAEPMHFGPDLTQALLLFRTSGALHQLFRCRHEPLSAHLVMAEGPLVPAAGMASDGATAGQPASLGADVLGYAVVAGELRGRSWAHLCLMELPEVNADAYADAGDAPGVALLHRAIDPNALPLLQSLARLSGGGGNDSGRTAIEDNSSSSSDAAPSAPLWWGRERIDYQAYCPQGLEHFCAATLVRLVHASYWESSDIAAFLARQILRPSMAATGAEASGSSPPIPFPCTEPRTRWCKVRTFLKTKGRTPNHRARDVIVLAEQEIPLHGRFSYGTLGIALTGELVSIYINTRPGQIGQADGWKAVGTQMTNRKGDVDFVVPAESAPRRVGVYSVRMIVRGDHSGAVAHVFIVRPGTQAVVFSIDGSFAANLSISGAHARVQAGAVDVVRYWADMGYLIVYISGRPELQQLTVVGWLSQYAFPLGFVALLPHLSSDPIRQKALYLDALMQVQKLQLVAGYGSAKDISLYQHVSLPPERIFIVGRSPRPGATVLHDGYLPHLAAIRATVPAPSVPFKFEALGSLQASQHLLAPPPSPARKPSGRSSSLTATDASADAASDDHGQLQHSTPAVLRVGQASAGHEWPPHKSPLSPKLLFRRTMGTVRRSASSDHAADLGQADAAKP